jgi:hypothetical protein
MAAYPPPTITIFSGINYNTDFFYSEDNEGILTSYVKKTGSTMTGSLTIKGASGLSHQLILNNNEYSTFPNIKLSSGGVYNGAIGFGGLSSQNYQNNLFLESTGKIILNANGNSITATPNFIINTNGNIGIGVLNPTNKLEVVGVISSTTGISSAGGISGATISGSTISTLSTFINSNSATGLPTIGTVGGTGDRIIVDLGTGSEYPHSIGVSADNSMWYSIPSGTRHQFYAGGSNILTIFGSTVLPIMTWRGNFDITSTVSTGNQVNISTTVANGVVNFLLANNEGFGCAIGVGGTSLTGNHRNNAFISANRDIIFNTFGRGSTSIPDMIITSNTTVGIGTTNPTATFDINNATNPRINLTRGALTSFISGTSTGLDIGNSSDTSSLTFNNGSSWPTVTINKINQIIAKHNTITPTTTGTGGYWLVDVTAYRFPTQYTSIDFSCSTNSGGNTGYYAGTVIINGISNTIASIIAASSNIFLTWQWTGAIMYIVVNVTGITVTAGAPLFYKCIG